MEIFKIVAAGILSTILILVIRQEKPELAILLSLTAGLIVFGYILLQIVDVFRLLQRMAAQAQVNLIYVDTIIKVVAIAYIGEFGAQICRDAGEGVMAKKIELGAKVIILLTAIPIFLAIMEALLGLLPQ